MNVPAELQKTESQKTVDAYLAELRRQLRELMDEDANDIVEEIRAHILDKTSSANAPEKIAATLAALGTPEELASQYRTDELLKRAQRTRSPLVSLHSLFRWATLSITGIIVFLVSVVGYTLGGALVLFVFAKFIFPHGTGLWESHNPDGTWSLGLSSSSGGPPAGAHDLLGWWLVLIGLVLGPLLIVLTFRFGSWSIRKFWRPRGWPRA